MKRLQLGIINFFSSRYEPRRSTWAHKTTVEQLLRVFPPEAVYESVSYPDPDKPSGATAELDVAVWCDPFLILAEVKAGHFRLESHLGDLPRLRTDLLKNIGDAFKQGVRAAKYVNSADQVEFRETQTGRSLKITRKDIREVFIMTVSLRQFANLATYLAATESLHLFQGDEYPWAISLADLEIVTQFCTGPDVFLHYFKRRLDLQRGTIEIAGDEVRVFGAYLLTRLGPEVFRDSSGKIPNFVSFADTHLEFDAYMEFRRGERRDCPKIELQLPPRVAALLVELRKRHRPREGRVIAHTILSLSNHDLMELDEMLESLLRSSAVPGRSGRYVYARHDLLICVCGLDEGSEDPVVKARRVAQIEKYKRRAGMAICLVLRPSPCVLQLASVAFVEGPWKTDLLIECALEDELLIPKSSPPKPFEPCFCGSKKKYRKCCGRKRG